MTELSGLTTIESSGKSRLARLHDLTQTEGSSKSVMRIEHPGGRTRLALSRLT
jgi:hypothetical protein